MGVIWLRQSGLRGEHRCPQRLKPRLVGVVIGGAEAPSLRAIPAFIDFRFEGEGL
jgi:hypothetical protein